MGISIRRYILTLFLGFSPDKTDIKPSIKDKIVELEEVFAIFIQEMRTYGTKDIFATTNNNYGSG